MPKVEGRTSPRVRLLRRLAPAVLGVELLFGLCAPAARAAGAGPTTVYAAFALKSALDEALAAYGGTNAPVRAVFGASPALVKQIEAGAPADLFISADPDWMDELARHGLIRPQSRVDLVGTRLVFAARAGEAPGRTLSAVPGFRLAQALGDGRLAICDPMMNPAGKYARASLERLGVWASVAGRVAPAENSGAAVALVRAGAVPLAIVFASDLVGQTEVAEAGSLPDDSHPPIVFPAALLNGSAGAEAPRLLSYLQSPAAMTIFARHGFTPPPGSRR